MSPVRSTGFAIEQIVWEIERILLASYDDARMVIDAAAVAMDQERADLRGVAYVPIVTEPVPAENIHPGQLPSFVREDDRLTNYPLIAIEPTRVAPDAEDARQDQQNVHLDFVTIHVGAKASPEEAEDVVYRRTVRMAEAIYWLVRNNPRLHHILKGVSNPMTGLLSEPWRYPAIDGHGDEWWFRVCGQEFQIKNYSAPEGGV